MVTPLKEDGSIRFRLNCVPPTTTHHSKRIVKIGKFSRLADTGKLVEAKRQIDDLLRPRRLPAPIRGPVSLTLQFTWPWRQKDSHQVRTLQRVPRATRPDCSNLAKTTEDRLVANGFLEDDGQVAELIVRKFYGDRPGILVAIVPLDPPLFQQPSTAAEAARTASV